jgi:Galactose oxidase, central domain/Kelch motif
MTGCKLFSRVPMPSESGWLIETVVHLSTTARVGVSLIFMLALLPVTVVLAAAPGTWSVTDRMTEGRREHLATLLTTGNVLIVGGIGSTGILTSADLYDPVQVNPCCQVPGTWSATGSTTVAHLGATATLLANGKVLLAGGSGGELPNLVSAELYDPATGTWSKTGSMTVGRSEHTATLLPNGKVLVAGGGLLASAELYDPATGTWSKTGSMTVGRSEHTATLLSNGKVLVAGGLGIDAALRSTELYEPATGAWTSTGSMSAGRFDHTATLLANGKVLVAGGATSGVAINTAELYDPTTGTWTQTGRLTTARMSHQTALLFDGEALATGGGNRDGITGSAELYDPTSGIWRPTGNMGRGRVQHIETVLPDGTVLVSGGGTPFGSGIDRSAERYDPPSAVALPSTCALSASGIDKTGHHFIKVAARDVATGLQLVEVVQATNASVVLPNFPQGFRDPAVVTATKVNPSQPSALKLAVLNRAGKTVTCDPVIATLVGQRDGSSRLVLRDIPRTESKVLLDNDGPGLDRVDLYVNGHHFRFAHLKDGEQRRVDMAAAMHPGEHNTVLVRAHGSPDGSAMLVISD